MIFLVDLDNTICDTEGNDYRNSVPRQEAIDRFNRLYEEGYTIVVFTGRGSLSGKDWEEFTLDQVNSWGLKFDTLVMGKPAADAIIDDKSVNVGAWLGNKKKGIKEVPKVWGKEIWLANNKKYCGKLLCINQGAKSSYHCHIKKMETFFCYDGSVVLNVEGKDQLLNPLSGPVTISPGEKHSFFGIVDSVIMEISTYHDDDDVVRLTESKGG